MAIFVTGDTHGDWVHRLNRNSFPEQKELTKDDIVIVCGDFGIWDNSRQENYNLDWLDERSFTTAFVDGNHSNFDLLDSRPVSQWHGGKVHMLRPSVIHLMRGQIYTIGGKTFFTFGGASSHDIIDGILDPDDFTDKNGFRTAYKKWRSQNKQFRVKGISWWERELPSQEEMNEGIRNLNRIGNKVDFIITHSPDSFSLRQLDRAPCLYETDVLTDYLFQIKENTEYEMHIFGHMHISKNLYECKSICIYEQIIRIL